MKPKKRIVALLLVWNIMIGMLPTVAFADNNSEIQLEEGVIGLQLKCLMKFN